MEKQKQKKMKTAAADGILQKGCWRCAPSQKVVAVGGHFTHVPGVSGTARLSGRAVVRLAMAKDWTVASLFDNP